MLIITIQEIGGAVVVDDDDQVIIHHHTDMMYQVLEQHNLLHQKIVLGV